MIEVKRASDFEKPEVMTQKAHDLFYDVYYKLPQKPVAILPRKREYFKPDQTLIAVDSDEVLGVTILEPGPDFNNNMLMFQSNAGDVLKCEFPDLELENIFMISSMAIRPEARGRGVGTALYKKAKELSKLKCIGVLYKNNLPGRHLAEKSGFTEIFVPTFEHKYSFIDNKHILNDNGEHVLKWNLFTSISQAV